MYKALVKGDIILSTDYIAGIETFSQITPTNWSIGKRWNKTAYMPMYRKISDAVEAQKPSHNSAIMKLPTCPKCFSSGVWTNGLGDLWCKYCGERWKLSQ
jgi:hypothetical protein